MFEVMIMTDKHDKKSAAQKKAEEAAKAFVSKETLKRDPSGSYTGHPVDKYDQPDQDGDDL
jgi:hypothetical protein